MSLILPQSTLDLLARVALTSRHPGLQLDKFSIPGDQAIQKQAIEDVISANNKLADSDAEFKHIRQNWLANVQSSAASVQLLRCTTTSPLTLHLSRASALENAGICLHPLYGFVYLPGSGLKGMARAFAETVWLPNQLGGNWGGASGEQWNLALDRIDAVFGYGPYISPKPDAHKRMSEFAQRLEDHKGHRDRSRRMQGGKRAHVGNIIFHDAWPETWPKLIVDIVNNHHQDYYQSDDNEHAPGDWENPVPVYFLAAPPGVTFTFPLAKRRKDVPDELLSLASKWLLGALCHLGAGAKTNAGYGAFRPEEDIPSGITSAVKAMWEKAAEICDGKPKSQKSPSQSAKRWAEFSTTLELVTPAFLAGASQRAEDCDLRPATLRGHLRWWWRTMHAGFVDVQTLRALEAAIWGNAKSGGAVRIVVTSPSVPRPLLFNRQVIVDRNNLPSPPDRKTTQGLAYFSYGMNDAGRQRYFLAPPHSWNLRIVARSANRPDGDRLTAEDVLSHAKGAMWLLSTYGGVGAKSRKGFGSLALSADLSQFASDSFVASATQQWITAPDIDTSTSNYWQVLDCIGAAAQAFSKK